MIYLSQMLGTPVVDSTGKSVGTVNDLGIATGEVFPRVTALSFRGTDKVASVISWRAYVATFDAEGVALKVPAADIHFSHLQPNEVLIARDLLNKQVVDTRGMRVVRVSDLKLSDTGSNKLRLLGAEVGARGILRSVSPRLEALCCRVTRAFGNEIPERIVAWNYMDLLDRDLSDVKLSGSHKTLDELHPADVADIIEQLDPRLRSQVVAQLDEDQAAEAMAELDDDQAAEIMAGMSEVAASKMLSEMDPDDAAELVDELDYDKAEALLRLMGVEEQRAVRQLLGYRDNTAGRIMTSEFVSLPGSATVGDAIERIRSLDADFEAVHYVYVVDGTDRLRGVLSLRCLLVSDDGDRLSDLAEDDVITAQPDDDQEGVAESISKYNLLAMPVVDEDRHILGIVTVDDALDVIEEEHEEDLQIAGGSRSEGTVGEPTNELLWFARREMWFFFWVAGTVALAFVGRGSFGPTGAFLVACAMPVALLVSDDMVSYVTNFFLECGPDDDGPSMVGFALKGLAMGGAFAALVWVIASTAGHALLAGDGGSAGLLLSGFAAAAATTVVSFATSPIYLAVLRSRDRRDKETSGLVMTVCSMVVAIAVFTACAAMLSGVIAS